MTACAPPAPKTAVRQDFLDGLRAMAATYVTVHHACLTLWPLDRPPVGAVMTWTGWLQWGHFAVTLFIAISGYCLTIPLARNADRAVPFWPFLKRRAQRILPPYYFGFLLSALLVFTVIGKKTGTHWDFVLPPTMSKIVLGLLLQPDVLGTINHAYWSIGVECRIYLLFPLIVLLQRRIGIWKTAAVGGLLAYAVAYAVRHTLFTGTTPIYLGVFCWGSAAAYVVHSQDVDLRRIRASRLWTPVFLVLVVLCAATIRRGYALYVVDVFAGTAAAVALVLLGRSDSGMVHRFLSSGPMVWLGGFSYSLYLIHAPLLQVIWQYGISRILVGPIPQFLGLVGIGVPFIVLSARVFYRFCEEPFIPKRP